MAVAPEAHAQTTPQGPNEWLCDSSYQDCRAPLIQLIRNETVRIDVAFWFMQDARFKTEIIKRWQAGVPVRVLVDPKANPTYPGNEQILADLAAAGIPMRQRKATAPGILHWKMMLFAGQNIVEFSGANFSPTAFVPQDPYADYEDEAIYFSDDPAVVQSFMTEYDNNWVETQYYSDYANLSSPPARVYPIFPKDPALNFPQSEDYRDRILKRFPKETLGRGGIDVIMYRITDERYTNAIIAAMQRGIPVRVLGETKEYRVPHRQWVSYNLDRIWAAGIPLRVSGHKGLNHQKLVLFHDNQPAIGVAAPLTVFGSSNWTTPSANRQEEHNYFTLKPWIFDYFETQFMRKWCSGVWAGGMPAECAVHLNPVGAVESIDFVPMPADKPINMLPADAAVNLNTTGIQLKWDPGFFGHIYDIYFGQDPNPPLYKADLVLGPVDFDFPNTKKTLTLPALQPGTTYYWRIGTKTMAGLVPKGPLASKGPIWSFTTKGTATAPPPPPPGATTQVIWASDVLPSSLFGLWKVINDPTAAGGKALQNTDGDKPTISPALAEPVNYFEATFTAMAGVPYHLWIRMRAQLNSLSNDSVSVQFSDAVDAFGSPSYRIGEPYGAEVILHDGPSGSISGWGWADNGFGTVGPDIYFATTGTHTIRIQQRTDGAIIDQIVLSPDVSIRTRPGSGTNDATILGSTISGGPGGSAPPLPMPWQRSDIGVVAINGMASYDSGAGTFSVIGSGGNAWGTSDGLYYAYQPLGGDGSIVARVTGVQNANVWSRAGVMIRETLATDSANTFMYLSAGKTLAFQRRHTSGASTFATAGLTTAVAPYWVRLDRSGDTFTAYRSTDGITWTFVGIDTVTMPPDAYVGLAVTSAILTATSLGTFDNVTVTPGTPTPPVTPPSPAPLPDRWWHHEIGPVGFTGDTTFDAVTNAFTVRGAGSNVAGTADSFHFAYRVLTGDGWILARVKSLGNTDPSAKAGVMLRAALDPGAAHAFMRVTPGTGTAFDRRQTAGGDTLSTPGTTDKAPYWVKVERVGDTFTASQSADGASWTLVGSDTIAMGSTIFVGLGVTSRAVMTPSAAVFEFVDSNTVPISDGVAPTIATQPESSTIAAGQTATLTVVVDGTEPLTYQWYAGTSPGTATAIPGATASSFTTPALTIAASYWMRVWNAYGSADTTTARISIGVPPTIATHPQDQIIPSGQTATLTVVAAGTAPLAYQWYAGTNPSTTTPIAGATSASFTTPALASAASYWARVSSPYGSAGSSTARISIGVPPTIATQPQSRTIASEETATLTVVAAGTPPFAYQWHQGTSPNATTPIADATASSHTTPVLTSAASYWVRVSSPYGIANSTTASISIGVAPTISTQPQSRTIASGQTATLAVAATGTASLTYHWYREGTTTPIPGATASSYTTPALTSEASYWVRVSNAYGSADSTPAVISIGAAPTIATQPQSQRIGTGQTATLSVVATGTAPLTYQWYAGTSPSTATPIPGATASGYTTPALAAATSYWVRVSNAYGNADSTTARISTGVAAVITTQPQSRAIGSGQTAILLVVATGTAPLGYQWYTGASGTTTNPIADATEASLTTPALTSTTSYWVRVSNADSSADSTTAVISAPPTITTPDPWPAATAGDAYALTLAAINSTPPYQWAASALPSGLTLNNATGELAGTPNAAGTFSVDIRVTGGDAVSTQRAFSLTVMAATDALLDQQWHLTDRSVEVASANVRPVWPDTRGAGVVIGIVDDGLQMTHPDLQGNYLAALSHDFRDHDADPSAVTAGSCGTTANCRGTSAAGIAAARNDNGSGGSGVAPLASLAGIRLAPGSVDADEASAFSHQLNAVHIENHSWHRADDGQTLAAPGPLAEAALSTAITQGRAGAGRIFVWAAGDGRASGDNCNFDGYANSRFGIAVGAVDDTGQQAAYSESCSALVVSAPSSGGARSLTTTDLLGAAGNDASDYTSGFGGTSGAAPVVSGVAALMLSRNPALTWRDVQHLLVRSSRQVNASDPSWTNAAFPHSEKYGFGVVDAVAAVNLAATWANVPAESAVPAVTRGPALAIPDNNAKGVSDSIAVGAAYAGYSIEHVEVEFTATHPRRGDLEVALTSPLGIVSHLGTVRSADTGANFTAWRFRSVRHWGESPAGTWTLTVADRAAGSTGVFAGWTLRIYGTAPPPAPPAPPSGGGGGAPGGGGGGGCAPEPSPAPSPVPSPAPGAPTGLASSVFGTTVVLSWGPPNSGSTPTTYILEAGSRSGASNVIVYPTGSAATSYTAIGVGAGVYFVRVRAANALGTSLPSNEIAFTVGAGAPPSSSGVPGPPTGLVASSSGSSVTLTWNRPTLGGAPAFFVVQAGSAPGLNDIANFSTGNTVASFSATGVGAGTYFVRVRAGNGVGTSLPSNEAVLVVGGASGQGRCAGPPSAPTGLQFSVSGSTVRLNWSPASGGPTSYIIEAGSSSGRADLVVSDTGNTTTSLTATGVGAGTYFVRMRARNACGAGAPSNEMMLVVR